jgi:uncharacterized membrane protein YqjE
MTKVAAIAVLLVVLGTVSIVAVIKDTDPLWAIGAGIVIVIALAVLLGIYALDAIFRSSRALKNDDRRL